MAGLVQGRRVCVHEVVAAVVPLQEQEHLALVPAVQALNVLMAGWAEVGSGPRDLWRLGVLTQTACEEGEPQ